jgi:iron complex outermembrane receptor protein
MRSRMTNIFQTTLITRMSLITASVTLFSHSPLAAGAEPGSSDALGEIVVTAQKRSESIMSVPISITALDEQAIRNAAPKSLSDLAGTLPSLQAFSGLGDTAPNLSLRGVASTDYSLNISSPVAAYTDEVYRGSPAFFSDQIYDLERIELLRGPQGTLYGRNATGGAINFISEKPGFDTEGYIGGDAGNFHAWSGNGAFQTALSSTVAARIAFVTNHQGDWQTNIIRGQQGNGHKDDYGVRLSLLFRPNDSLEAILRVATSQVMHDRPAIYSFSVPGGIGVGIEPTPYVTTFGYTHTARTEPDSVDSASHDLSLTLTWGLAPNLDLISVSSYNRGFFSYIEDADQSPLSIYQDAVRSYGDQFAEDLRLTSKFSGRFNYIAGVYYGKDAQHLSNSFGYYLDVDFNGDGKLNGRDCLYAQSIGYYPLGCNTTNDFRQIHTSEAGYTDVKFSITDALKLVAGVRYSHDKLESRDYTANTYGSDNLPLFNTIPGSDPAAINGVAATQDRAFDATTGRLGLEYTLPQGTLLYGTLSRGYRPGGLNSTALQRPSEITFTKPEILESAELGLKSFYFNRHLQLTANTFYYRYKNQQTIEQNPVTLLVTTQNLGRSTIKGAEVELTAKPVAPLTVNLGISWLNTLVNDAVISGQNVSGNHLIQAPTFSGTSSLTWSVLENTEGRLNFYWATRYTDRQFTDTQNTLTSVIPAYAISDTKLYFDFKSPALQIGLWSKNVFNRSYDMSIYGSTSGFGFIYTQPGTPRTFGVNARYSF